MKSKQFSFRARARSFRFAWEGVARFFAEEHNAWIHLVFTILVLIAAWYSHVTNFEFLLLIIVIGLVWVAEIFNTAIEKIMDFIEPGHHPHVKRIKDLSAAAVLVSACTALATGAFIFIPKLF